MSPLKKRGKINLPLHGTARTFHSESEQRGKTTINSSCPHPFPPPSCSPRLVEPGKKRRRR